MAGWVGSLLSKRLLIATSSYFGSVTCYSFLLVNSSLTEVAFWLICIFLVLFKGTIKWQYKLWLQCCQRLLRGLDGCWNIGSIKGLLKNHRSIQTMQWHFEVGTKPINNVEWHILTQQFVYPAHMCQVVRCCIEHAAVVAKSFLTSDVVIVEAQESKPVRVRPPMPPRNLIPPMPASGNYARSYRRDTSSFGYHT